MLTQAISLTKKYRLKVYNFFERITMVEKFSRVISLANESTLNIFTNILFSNIYYSVFFKNPNKN